METLGTGSSAAHLGEGSQNYLSHVSRKPGPGEGGVLRVSWRGCQPCTRLWPALGPRMTSAPRSSAGYALLAPLCLRLSRRLVLPLCLVSRDHPRLGVLRLTQGPAHPGRPGVHPGRVPAAPLRCLDLAGRRSCPTSPRRGRAHSSQRLASRWLRPPSPAARSRRAAAFRAGPGRRAAAESCSPCAPSPGGRSAGGRRSGGRGAPGRGPRGAGRGGPGLRLAGRGAGRLARRGGAARAGPGRPGPRRAGQAASAPRRGSWAERLLPGVPAGRGGEPGGPGAMRRSSTDDPRGPAQPVAAGQGAGLRARRPPSSACTPAPPGAAQARHTSPKGNKYVVFYLDLSFIFPESQLQHWAAVSRASSTSCSPQPALLGEWRRAGSPLPLGGGGGGGGGGTPRDWLGVCLGSLGPGQRGPGGSGTAGVRQAAPWAAALHPPPLCLLLRPDVPHPPWRGVGPRAFPSAGPLAPSAPPCPRLRGHSPPVTRLPGSKDRTCRGGRGRWDGRASPPLDRLLGRTGAGASGLSGPSAGTSSQVGACLTLSKVAGFAQMRCLCPGSELLVPQGAPSSKTPNTGGQSCRPHPGGGWAECNSGVSHRHREPTLPGLGPQPGCEACGEMMPRSQPLHQALLTPLSSMVGAWGVAVPSCGGS